MQTIRCLIGRYRNVFNVFKIPEPTVLSIELSINHTKCRLWQNGNSIEPTSNKCNVINLKLSSNSLVVLGYAAAGQPSSKTSYEQSRVLRIVSALKPLSKLG